MPKSKKKKNSRGTSTNIQSATQAEEVITQKELEEFIKWTENYEEFDKIDWNYYRSQGNGWEKSFKKWNKLRADRISLFEQWKEEQEQ